MLFAAQNQSGNADVPPKPSSPQNSAPASAAFSRTDPSNYVLGPSDKLTVTVQQLDEIKQVETTVDLGGDLEVPLLGTIHAGGKTLNQVSAEIKTLAHRYVKDPQVSVSITEYRSQPISILGAVNNPAVSQLQGRKTLFEVISNAGGLRPDAGTTVQITREMRWGPLPLPGARTDASGEYSVASVNVKSILHATDPTENISLRPGDVVAVPRADIVYCVGSVRKPGGFPLGQNESLSALQVLSLAEGLDKNSAPDRAKVLRLTPGSTARIEIPVDLKKLTAGQSADVPLKSDDILFIPSSLAKTASSRTLEAIIQAATGVAIYGRY